MGARPQQLTFLFAVVAFGWRFGRATGSAMSDLFAESTLPCKLTLDLRVGTLGLVMSLRSLVIETLFG